MPTLVLHVVELLLLMAVTLLAPGLVVVRRWRLNPVEKLCAAIAVSSAIIYLCGLGMYVAQAPAKAAFVVSGLSAVLLMVVRQDVATLLAAKSARRGVWIYLTLVTWALLLTAMITHFSGAQWAGDWYEHWERAHFWMGQLPHEFQFIGMYWLPARPPMQNVLAAFYLNQVGDDFALFQVCMTVLNLLAAPFAWALAQQLVGGRIRPRATVMAAVLVTSPLLLENVTWTWTKMLAAAYIALAAAFYVAAWRKDDRVRMLLAFTCLSIACLVHYSALLYAATIFGHYCVVTLIRRRWAVREWLETGVVNVLLLASWVGYSVASYGAKITFESNTTAAGYASADKPLVVMAFQVINTIIPPSVRGLGPPWEESGPWDALRDNMFHHYQLNLPFAVGSLSWAAVVYLFVLLMRAPGYRLHRMERWFWVVFIVTNIVGGAAVHPPPIDLYGVTHVSLQPIVLLGLTLLAAGFRLLPMWAAVIVAVSRAVDGLLGVSLQMIIQSCPFMVVHNGPRMWVENPWQLSGRAASNWMARRNHGLVWMADYMPNAAPALRVIAVLGPIAAAAAMLRAIGGRRRGPEAVVPASDGPPVPLPPPSPAESPVSAAPIEDPSAPADGPV